MSDDFGFTSKEDVIIFKLGRIEALLTELQIQTAANQVAQKQTNADFEKRLGSLERTRSYALGIVAGVTAFITIGINIIMRYWHP